MRKIVLFALMTIMLITYINPSEVYANDKVKENESKIDKLDDDKKKVKKEIKSKKDKIEELMLEVELLESETEMIESEIERNKKRLKKVREQIKETKNEIKKLQDSIDSRRDIVGERLQAHQVNGEVDYLDVLFGSDSFTDFITRMHATNRILEADNDIIDSFMNDLDVVEIKLKEVEEMEEEIEKLKERNEVRRDELKDNIKKTKKKQKKLKSQIKKLDVNTKDIEKEQDKLLKKINKELGMKIGLGKGKLEWPTISETYISSPIGVRTHPKTGEKGRFHSGIDIARNDKSKSPPIYAAEEGVVIEARKAGGYGNMIKIKHDKGVETLYAHLSKINVKVGQEVRRGQTIGIMGTTGMSTGIHLHFEVFDNGKLQNPLRYVK